MSSAELQRTGAPIHLCQRCRDRKARFRYRGVIRADRDHPPSLLDLRRGTTLCFECYRGEMNRARARRLTETATQPMRSPFGRQEAAGSRALNERQRAHRQRMLDHLLRQSAVAS